MNFRSTFAILMVCLIGTSILFNAVEAGKKKKILGALLLGAALFQKPKILPLPLPIPIPIKKEVHVPYPQPYPVYKTKYVSVPEPYPVYYGGGGYSGGGGGYGGEYGGDDHY